MDTALARKWWTELVAASDHCAKSGPRTAPPGNKYLCLDCADKVIAAAMREALDEMHKRLGSLIHRNKKGDLIADDWGCAVAASQNEIGAALREGK